MQPRDWQLPILACRAVGGVDEQAIPAVSALACAQVGIILIDDMLDEDPRGEYHRVGEGHAANIAAAFLSAGIQAILQSTVQPKARLEALCSLNQMVLGTALGQYLDSQNPSNESDYWRVVENKSAPFYGAAMRLGAVFGNASGEMAEHVERIGRIYGEIIQIHDDLNDTLAVPANPDWLQGRSPLPILFAKSVDHPERSRFLELLQEVSDENALREAQEILIRCGAVSYCVDQLLRRYQSARDVLAAGSLPRRDVLDALLEEVVAPVWRLFEAIGEAPVTFIPKELESAV
jgi:geranylgeranyl pyrophosphate synthase